MAKKNTEVTVITPDSALIQPLNEVVINSGLEKTKAEKYAMGYAPLMREVIEQSDLLKGECQVIGTQVLNKISHILSYIKEESKKLS